MADDSLASSYFGDGLMVDYGTTDTGFNMTANATQGAADIPASPSLIDTLWNGTKATFSSVGSLASTALQGAKSKVASSLASSLMARPDVQAEVRQSAGTKVGSWVLNNWKYLALGALVIAFIVVRSMRK